MKRQLLLGFLIFVFIIQTSLGQEEIRFADGNLSAILSIAQERNKNVFIDTYANWCEPCKRMKKKFKDKDVAKFFNEHFINYRVNMQNPMKANQLRKRYDIVFLPTMLIVDPQGVVKYQVDRELTVSELLNMGQSALDAYHVSEATAVRRNTNHFATAPKTQERNPSTPPSQSTTTSTQKPASQYEPSLSKATRRAQYLDSFETVEESSQKVLAVLGADELPPEVLLQEAYLRLEFMDGSHKEAARKYLATQKNWDTETNRKFILDFVNNFSSPEYEFIIQNRQKFDTQFGRQAVLKTLEIITYRALHNAVPRPSLNQSIELYQNLGVKEPIRQGYHYYTSRLISEDKMDEVLIITDEYLSNANNDHEFQYTVARYLTNRQNRTEKDLIKANELMKKAIVIEPSSLIYLELLGKIYTAQGNTSSAKKTYRKAIQEAKKQGKDYKSFEEKSLALNVSLKNCDQ